MEDGGKWLHNFYNVRPSNIITVLFDDRNKDLKADEEITDPEIVSPTKVYSCPVCDMIFKFPSEKENHKKDH